MADDLTYTSTDPAGVPDATKQVTDEHATRGHMPVVKVAVAADGDATLLPATAADGLLVNLGANNDVTVTGTVSVTEPVSVDDNGGSLTVDNAALAVVGGGTEATALRVTVASDSTGVVSVDDNGGSLTVDGTVAVSGTVTVDTELPAAASLTDNFANPTAPGVGAFVMGWDGATWDRMPGNSTDGQLVNLGANNDVTVTGSVSVTGSVDTELPAAAALADNTANPTVPAVGSFLMGYDGTNWDRVRADGGSVFIQDGGNSITVDGTVGVSGSVDTELPAAASLADNASNPTAPAVGAFGMVWDGATWDRAAGNSTDGALVNLGANNDVTVTGTVTANQGTANSSPWEVMGDVAQDSPITGNPLPTGLRASDAEPTAMSLDGDSVYAWGDRSGRFVTTQKASTTSVASVAGSATSVTLIASNTGRLGATIYNDSTAILYLKLGATASTSSFTAKLFQDGYYEVPFGYTGVIDGIWASATGNARTTEVT